MNPTLNGIGKPGMIGVGPGQNLRKKYFEALQKDVKKIFDYLHAHPSPTKDDIKGFLDHYKPLQSDVKKYCTVPGTEAINSSYVNALTALEIVWKEYNKTDAKKLAETLKREVPRIHRELQSIVQANYVAPPAPPPAPPARPASGPTGSGTPPARPASGPTGSK